MYSLTAEPWHTVMITVNLQLLVLVVSLHLENNPVALTPDV